jgi:hypothetical protein
MPANSLRTLMMICGVVVPLLIWTMPGHTAAEDFEPPTLGPSRWRVFDFETQHMAVRPDRIPDRVPGGLAFDFFAMPDTALFGTRHPSLRGTVLGDLTGQTVTATVGVTVTSGQPQFTYFGAPDVCDRAPNVRLYFRTNPWGTPQEETDHWWSNPTAVALEALQEGHDHTLTASLADPSQWSDGNGHFASDPVYTAAFFKAVQEVRFIGVSFGGGCFFANGVGTVPGTGRAFFRLMEFTVTPAPRE